MAKFAAAPFGIVEREPTPLLPVTLRHVQGELRRRPAARRRRAQRAASSRVSLQSDADILAWFAQAAALPRDAAHGAGARPAATRVVHLRGRPRRARPRRSSAASSATSARARCRCSPARPARSRLDLPQLDRRRPAAVRGGRHPARAPGYHVVEIESQRLGQSLLDKRAPMYVRTGALVTNLGVHFKLGRENSARLGHDARQRQAGAQAPPWRVNDCSGKPLWHGTHRCARAWRVVAAALDAEPPSLPAPTAASSSRARKADAHGGTTDLAFIFSDWQNGIEPWRFNVPTSRGAEPDLRAHTVFDRTLLRAGETVSMKHFVRTETATRPRAVRRATLPDALRSCTQGSGQEFVAAAARWTGSGGAARRRRWTIPPAAKLGVYQVVLERERAGAGRRRRRQPSAAGRSGSFRVEEFRLPLLEARIAPAEGRRWSRRRTLPIDVQINYVAGGGDGDRRCACRRCCKPRALVVRRLRRLQLRAAARPEAGRAGDATATRRADAARPRRRAGRRQAAAHDRPQRRRQASRSKDLPASTRPRRAAAEASYADPNGEVQTLRNAHRRCGRRRGRSASRPRAGSRSRGKTQVPGARARPGGQADRASASTCAAARADHHARRKRMVGGFYTYDNRTEVKELGTRLQRQERRARPAAVRGELDDGRPGRADRRRRKDAQGHAVAGRQLGLGHAAGRALVRRRQPRPHRRAAREEALRARRDGAAPGAHAVPLRDRAGHGRARRRDRRRRSCSCAATTRRSSCKVEPGWGPNVYVSVLALRGRLREVPWYCFFTWGFKAPREWWTAFWYEGREYVAPTALVDLSQAGLPARPGGDPRRHAGARARRAA